MRLAPQAPTLASPPRTFPFLLPLIKKLRCAPPYPLTLNSCSEHIDLGLKYDPATGIFGMDFYVVLARPGFRVARRKHATGRVGASHKIGVEDSKTWFKTQFEGVINEDK